MGPHDKRRFAELMTMVAEVYGREITAQKLAFWFDLLSDYEIDAVERAARDHMRASKFMPTPAELIERMQPAVDQRALLAWAEVSRLLRNSRAARSADPITERAVADLGGWIHLGQRTAQELVWIEKGFAKRYEMHATHGADVQSITDRRGGIKLIGGGA